MGSGRDGLVNECRSTLIRPSIIILSIRKREQQKWGEEATPNISLHAELVHFVLSQTRSGMCHNSRVYRATIRKQ
jgi:hypothetical protein